MMNDKLRNIITKIFCLFPINETILMESVPDYSDNTFAVYKELIKRGIQNKHKIIWIANNEINETNVTNCNQNSFIGSIKFCYYNATSKYIISCNYIFSKYRKKQVNFFLNHATTFKRIKDYYILNDTVDYNLVAADGIKKMMCYQQNFQESKTYATGFARNDDLFIKTDIRKLFNDNFGKIIVWYPTFRQHKCADGLVTDGLSAIPLLDNEIVTKELNNLLAQYNIGLVIKPHFAQDISYIKNLCFSNIVFINDDFFRKNNISSYSFVGNCDALITDYSSVFFDYTLCDRPIALIWTDIEYYLEKPGLIDNYEYYSRGTHKIYTFEELKNYIQIIADGLDPLQSERNELKKEVNRSFIPDNAKWTADFIIDKANLFES